MPHAALWVVQQSGVLNIINANNGFNAARGFVGGAAQDAAISDLVDLRFNAARGFVGGAAQKKRRNSYPRCSPQFQCRTRLCGWCSFVARSPCPPREKKPFWKVSGNLRCLTENM